MLPIGFSVNETESFNITIPVTFEISTYIQNRARQEALFAEEDGLALLKRLIRTAPPWLEPGGCLLLEVGLGQAAAVSALLNKAGFSDVATHRDLAGIERVVSARLREARLRDAGSGT